MKNVLKSNGTEVVDADGVPLVFKMKQLKGVRIYNLLNQTFKYQSKFRSERWQESEREYFT